jgi:hypothetical protein
MNVAGYAGFKTPVSVKSYTKIPHGGFHENGHLNPAYPANKAALARFEAKLRTLPPTGAGYHPALLGAANAGLSAGLSDDDIFNGIRIHTDESARRVHDSEICQAINKAKQGGGIYRANQTAPGRRRSPPPEKLRLPYPPAVWRQRLIESGRKYSEQDFVAASSMHLSGHPADAALCVLDAFYSADEYLFIGHRLYEKVHPVSVLRVVLADAQAAAEFMPAMPHVIPNPVTGELHPKKDGGLSYRCDNAVKDYRFAVAEFDTIPRADQLAFWASVPLPVAALIDSGKKSIHAWIRLEQIYTPEDWRITVKETLYKQMLVPMGCDPACSNPARLSRFAGHCREEGQVQKLLYVNQNPSPNGIFKD